LRDLSAFWALFQPIITSPRLIIFWLFWPYNPIDISPSPWDIIQHGVLKQGSYLTYHFDYKKNTHDVPVIQTQFEDGIVFQAGDSNSTVIEPGDGTAYVQIKIPESLPPGQYALRVVRYYKVNPIRTIRIENHTETFEVVAAFDNDLDDK